MSFFKNRAVIASIFFIIGAVTSNFLHKFEKPFARGSRHNFHIGFNSNGFDESRDLIENFFGEDISDQLNGVGSQMQLFGFNGGGISDMQVHSDETNYYYELDLQNSTPKEFRVSIENGQMNIQGQMETKDDESGRSTVMTMSFNRSFPVPPDADADSYSMEQQGQKLVIKVPKKME